MKLYKGEMTSDGTPLNEMRACLAAGEHANLIRVEGRITGHPEQRLGLVMQMVDRTRYRNLADLPSLASCTRDVYSASGEPFGAAVLLRIASGVASVGAHLHARGITHGDLYAHNILWSDDGHCLLGDFGAASFQEEGASEEEARALQRVEVRAFGVLLGELLERNADLDAGKREKLDKLVERCFDADVLARPSFAQIEEALASV